MPRKLKTFQTSVGFYDLAIAAPSMKAALEAWGAGSNLFHQGFASETDDPEVVAATLAKPGVVLKRPAGSNGSFAEHAGLPTGLSDAGDQGQKKRRPGPAKVSDETARKAAIDFERERERRDAERRREEAAKAKQRAKREKLVVRAQAALDQAQREHEQLTKSLAAERDAIEKRIEAEDAQWNKKKEQLTKALRIARE
jgi:colicin import membrane protein